MIASFQAILNRDDCSTAQAQAFILQGIGRAQRELRLPCQEREQVITAASSVSWIPVPPDLLEIIDVIVPGADGYPAPLNKVPYRQLIRMDPNSWACAYARFQGQIFIAGSVPTGSVINLLYFGQFTAFATADSDNELSASNPDIAVYAALRYASDTFSMPTGDAWEATYQAIKAEVQGLAIDLEMNGGPAVMAATYSGWEE